MMTFTFKGTDSATYGVYLTEHPTIVAAEKRVEFIEVPGRDGALSIYDGAFNDIEMELMGYMQTTIYRDDILGWLTGSGDLVLSTDTTRAYRARVTGQVEIERVSRGLDAWLLRIPVRLQPFRYHSPAPANIVKTVSGQTVTNPGTYKSRPRIAIVGSGDIDLWIGTQLVELAGVETGFVIDSEAMDCYAADGVTLDNGKATLDDYPTLAVGANLISWTGAVTSVTITPRWRDM